MACYDDLYVLLEPDIIDYLAHDVTWQGSGQLG